MTWTPDDALVKKTALAMCRYRCLDIALEEGLYGCDGDCVLRGKCDLRNASVTQARVALIAAHPDIIAAERAKADELQALFDLCWEADSRAIKMWQAETGKDMTWPDRAHMVVWLLHKADALAEALREAVQYIPRMYRTETAVSDRCRAALAAYESDAPKEAGG